VNVSPSVISVVGLLSPVGTITVFVPQTSIPVSDVTIWLSGKVIVVAGGRALRVEVKVMLWPPDVVVKTSIQEPSDSWHILPKLQHPYRP
jgi:hypothetical protein